MARDWIVVGDTTSHGGSVLAGDSIFQADGKPVARIGDPVVCPKCKGVFPIISGSPNLIGSNGNMVARQGDSTACGAILVAGGQIHGVWIGNGPRVQGVALSSPDAASYDRHFQLVDDRHDQLIDGSLTYRVTSAGGDQAAGRVHNGLTGLVRSAQPEDVELLIEQTRIEI